ncbi:PAS domain-containing sensor histidine kinase [Georgfuchsia toluolica]|uniref:histidine kinase n=1 Tax=Georgfuchsia toluolica TaxID=424218 RepID=A0A916J4Z3_9PROT|nr:ATP-binding protein [Georgfuchsia toluolica]CAG4884000.1 PAS domain-containing sensor histidine kinase [Georgfuchsia toluolica]
MKILLIAAAAAGAILLSLLTFASANTDLFARQYPLLMGANAIIAVALLVMVGMQLRILRREYRRGVFGSRLKTRLLLILASMAVLPGLLVYGVSMQFAVNSIESWFNVRVDSALEGGLTLGRNVLDSLQADHAAKARNMALYLSDTNEIQPARLDRLREQSGVQTATVLTSGGQVIASSSSDLSRLLPPLPTPVQLRQAQRRQGLSWVDGDAETGLTLHVLAPVSRGMLGNERILQLTQPVPAAISHSAENVEAAYRSYQELQLGKRGLKRIYTMTLTLALLLALLAAAAAAFFLAKRMAQPLLILAEGTQAVAAGDFTPRAELETPDEMGVLTQSFNRMTRQLAEAKRDAERHREELEAARGYLESVLANLSTGVLAFDTDFRLRSANRGATAILDDTLEDVRQLPLLEWHRHTVLAEAIAGGFEERGPEWQLELEIGSATGAPKRLLVRGSVLPFAAGYVVVFDDISDLIVAQRSAAWGEVARRLAHEIKNPLTPIQLSAERLQFKLAGFLNAENREMLERSTQTIVSQVQAMKNMVNDFRDYARMPSPELSVLDLNALVDEVLRLYEGSHAQPVFHPDPHLPMITADGNQMRQVLHNLLRNAQDALGNLDAPCIDIQTGRAGQYAMLKVSDNGGGFAPQTLARAFEPYVTTKPRGTGLGLAIVKKIIDEHKGEIRLANRASGGAEIVIKLPLAESAVAAT